jgi:hypothetical protein
LSATIPFVYIETLLLVNHKLRDRGIEWAVSGDLGEALYTVHAEPKCIEIITNKKGAEQIQQAVQEYTPTEIKCRTEPLSRGLINDKTNLPVNIRSYLFEFKINSVYVKVYADVQFQVSDWGFGKKLEFEPDYVYVVGQRIPVIPLSIKYTLYRDLGWTERAEKILKALNRTRVDNAVHLLV